MKTIEYGYDHKAIGFFGRTLTISEEKATFFNWTCSGFEFECEASLVEATFKVDVVEEDGEKLYPWIMVLVDEEAYQTIELKEDGIYTLFKADHQEKHHIKVLKRTEAQHSKTALKGLRVEGVLLEENKPNKMKIEFIGDSITCGYGIEGEDPSPFITSEENGYKTYAALTAKALDADFQCVSVSGIGIYSSYTGENRINRNLVMSMVYEYQDRYLEMYKGKEHFTSWDFKKFIPDIIVINLGTNDWSYMMYAPEERSTYFKEHYQAFLKQVRALNGKTPKIICCLGVMEGGLNEAVREAVEAYKEETGDGLVRTLLFEKQRQEDGIGANGHPSAKTHEHMAKKLALALEKWM